MAVAIAVGIVAAASSITLAPGANADDDSYLANLGQHGIITFKNPQGLIATGHAICNDLKSGVSLQDEMGKFQAAHYESTPQGVAIMVNAAHDELCPG